MHKMKRLRFVLAALALLLAVGTTTTALADGGGDSGGGSSPSSEKIESEAEDAARAQGQRLLALAKKEHQSGKSQAQIAKVCDARKKGIEIRTARLVGNAQASLTRINKVLNEVVTFQKTNNVAVANFSALVAMATAAQMKATTSVQALAAVNPTIDCTSTSAASQLATFKAAVAQARTDLIAYRSAVQQILSAVESASGIQGD